jgi:HEPN domain-containing protein
MTALATRGVEYIRWQNRAFRFYVAARVLHEKGQSGPAAFSAYQAVELMMKATLHYWDKSFNPRDAGHNLKKMQKMMHNKVKGRPVVRAPEYFTHEKRFQELTRYPRPDGAGVFVPGTLIADLDRLMVEMVSLVPFQFNSELWHAASGTNRRALLQLRRRNAEMRRLRRAVNAKPATRPTATRLPVAP